MSKIVVSATALGSSGGLSILRQFLDYAGTLKEHEFIVFVPSWIKFKEYSNVHYIHLKRMNWVQRIKWDWYDLKSYLKLNHPDYNLTLCLQNTSLNVPGRKLIYLQQSLPFCEVKFCIKDMNSFKLWLYKKFYGIFIFKYVDEQTDFIVQTEWMKDALCIKGVERPKIHVVKPYVKMPAIVTRNIIDDNSFEVLYPATPLFYKNHIMLLESFNILQKEFGYSNLKLHVTFLKGQYKKFDEIASKYGLESLIQYHGVLSYDELIKLYMSSSVVAFPSYIETYGLPLLEAASLGKYIIASDLPYAREVLQNYDYVKFVEFDKPNKWAIAMNDCIRNSSIVIDTLPLCGENKSDWNLLNKFFKVITDVQK